MKDFVFRYVTTAFVFVAAVVALERLMPRGNPQGLFLVVWTIMSGSAVVGLFAAWRQNRRNWRGETSYYVPELGGRILAFLIGYPVLALAGYFTVGALT